ncbi:hypothetical protein J6590_006732 [Homalodisca vitripennis]|nr:hypothetical protein J6590_006732 [Homalodisca vitripennis]
MARQIRTSPDHTTTQAQQLQTGDLCKELQANTGKQQPRACTADTRPCPHHTATQAQQLQTSDLCKELQANTGKQQPRACTVRYAHLPRTTPWHRRSNYRPELQANTDKQQPRACTVRYAFASHHTMAQAQQLQTGDLCKELQANTDKQQPRACNVRHAPLPRTHQQRSNYRPVICKELQANTGKQQPRACTVRYAHLPRTTPWHRRSNYRPVICTRAPASHHTVAQAQQLQTGDLCKELQANTDKQQPRACNVRHAPLPRNTPWHRRSNYRPVICVRSCKPTLTSNNHELVPSDTHICLAPHHGTGAATTDR